VKWDVLFVAVDCSGTDNVPRTAGGVVVMKDPNEAKLPVRVNSQWARRDPDTLE
jgi:hypothetical protein